MKYVDVESSRKAEAYGSRLAKLPSLAGILFAAVRAVPIEGGSCKEFDVFIGRTSQIGEAGGDSLVSHVFEEDIKRGEMSLREVTCVVGYAGAANSNFHARDAGTHSPSS